jgi:hypothetical protein
MQIVVIDFRLITHVLMTISVKDSGDAMQCKFPLSCGLILKFSLYILKTPYYIPPTPLSRRPNNLPYSAGHVTIIYFSCE